MSTCYKCKVKLSIENCYSNKSKKNGLGDICKMCQAIVSHEYYLKNKDRIKNKVCIYAKENRLAHNVRGKMARDRLRNLVFEHYSNGDKCCAKCRESDMRVLSIDHIDGNGSSHRKLLGKGKSFGGCQMYQWLKTNKYPEGFQVLCHNCQFRKRIGEMRSKEQTHLQQVRTAYARSVKIACLNQYGGIQCSCGENDLVTLTLDHVNNDGSNHRKETGVRGYGFYIMLRKQQYPAIPALQVLCMNCQFRKRHAKDQERKIGQTDGSDASIVIVREIRTEM